MDLPCQKQARNETQQEMKTVPRRPNFLFMGSVIPVIVSKLPSRRVIVLAASSDSTAEIGGRVGETSQPTMAHRARVNTELSFIENLSTVDNCFIHALDDSTEGANCKVVSVVSLRWDE